MMSYYSCKLCNNKEDKRNEFCWEHMLYRVEFSKELENFKKKYSEIIEYQVLEFGYYNQITLCDDCLHGLFFEVPEIFKKIERVIPK